MAGSDLKKRTPPPRRFENYVLTRIVDSSAGLTNIPQAAFKQAPGFGGLPSNDDGYTDTLPIGFDFELDGIVYKQLIACCNGFLVLVDPSTGVFAQTEVFKTTPFLSNYINADIAPQFSSNAVLLAPWFDDLRNAAADASELTGFLYNYSPDKASRITQGLESQAIYSNPTSYGISYYLDTRSERGRRLIIRWASVTNYSQPSSIVRFEVVIYENGTIEYRYSPRVNIKVPTTQYEGATCGIFMPGGTNRFRDFSSGLGYRDGSRQEYQYGGFVYDPNWSDAPGVGSEDTGFPATPYAINLLPFKHWPGLEQAGCILRFSPPTIRRKVLPRKVLAHRDAVQTYPSVARTGDSRLGRTSRGFDDRTAPMYGSQESKFVITPFAGLDNLSWLIPRVSDATSQVYNCADPAPVSQVLTGDPGTIFNVTLRFRGVVELKTYTGGTNDGAHFQNGGTPANDHWNVYRLDVSNPAGTYYLNRGTSGLYSVTALDYTATIPVAGGATVTLTALSLDGQEIANNSNTGGPLSVPGITNPAQPYAGQFIIMNFVASTVASSTTPVVTGSSPFLVNYPSTLTRFFGGNGLGTSERQDLFAGDFMVRGNIVKSAIDQFVYEEPWTSIDAFNETSRFEQSADGSSSAFYVSGTNAEHTLGNFGSSLRSKTQVRISLPVNYNVALPPATSSIFYYNTRTKSWEVPAHTTYVLNTGFSVTNPPTPLPAGQAGGDWANPRLDAIAGRISEDARGFGPTGMPVSSGSHTPAAGNGSDQTDSVICGPYSYGTVSQVVGKSYAKSVRSNEEYAPSIDETFTLPINTPFLIEKAVFEIPLAAGPGWFADNTQCFLPVQSPGSNGFDFAGPAMTVALFRHIPVSKNSLSPSMRDLILTGTITHKLDDVSYIDIRNFPPDDTNYQVRPIGFRAYGGTPGAVVTPNGQNQFTGSVQVQAEALSTAGVLLKVVKNFAGGGSAAANASALVNFLKTSQMFLGDLLTVPAQTVRVAQVSPVGRSAGGFQQSGRAILGNEYAVLQGLDDVSGQTAANPFLTGSLTAQQLAALQDTHFAARCAAVVPLITHFPSPYLVMPGDKLFLSLAKMRPFLYGGAAGISKFSGSLQHDVVLTAGNINITLYGSLVKEGNEFHDPLNQTLGSNVVHEIIGAEPVLDQFQPAYRNEYTGSYTDNAMYGTLSTTTTRDRKLSWLNARNAPPLTNKFADCLINPWKGFRSETWWERAGNIRTSQFTDATERYWDSMMPDVAAAFAADGTGIFMTPPNTFGDFRQVDVGATTASLSTQNFDVHQTHPGWIMMDNLNPSLAASGFNTLINGNWNKSFPFEPRYQGVSRQLDISKGLLATYTYTPYYSGGSYLAGTVSSIVPTPVNGLIFGTVELGTAITRYSFPPYFNVTYKYPNYPMNTWFADVNLISTINNAYTNPYTGEFPATGMYSTGSAPFEDTAKVLFGFGDRNTHYQISNNDGSKSLLGTNHFPDCRDVEGPHPDGYWTYFDNNLFKYSPVIRGWKYGVASGVPLYSKSYWRRDRFGQFRDMLEQRPFTKYYQSPVNSSNVPNFQQGVQPAAVTVTFLDAASGRLTAPDNTWSSNLHFECTSSLPFFDGQILNRPTIIPSNLNLHPNVIRHDRFGNIYAG